MNIGKRPRLPCYQPLSLQLSPRNITKIYIGYLPVTVTEAYLREACEKYCPIPDLIIKKANAQGQFDKYCYGFVTLGCPENKAMEVIDRLSEEHPTWRIKIKTEDGPRNQMSRPPHSYQQPYNQMPPPMAMHPQQPMHPQQSMHQQPMHQQPQHHQQFVPQHQPMHQMQHHNQRVYTQNQSQNDKGEIFGEKNQRIMVRELWLGGIPEQTDHHYMATVMSQFGQVEATEIFPKFAFVKYRRAADAALAFENASQIYTTFGSNTGFRISFSDPSRRKDIVANHYELERNSLYVPTLFLGFPPITSARIEMEHMLNICEKYGPIVSYYLKKSTNNQMRSYFLFTYDNLVNAKRAKQELCRRKDLLGEKRVEITLLLDEESVITGRDFNYTMENFAIEQGEKIRRPNRDRPSYNQPQQPYMGYPPAPMMGGYNHMPPPPYGYAPPNYTYPPNYPNPNMGYYPPYQAPPPNPKQVPQGDSSDKNIEMFDLIQSMLDDPQDKSKVPQKNDDDGEDANDIISKMLGKGNEEGAEEDAPKEEKDFRDREPDWAGFLTWKGNRRAGVDGYFVTGEFEFADYSINVTSVLTNECVVMKDRSRMMVLEPTNSISQPLFQQYIKVFGRRTGVSVTKNWLIYVIGKTELSDSIRNIKDNELLIVLEKTSLSSAIKDKIEPIDDAFFQ